MAIGNLDQLSHQDAPQNSISTLPTCELLDEYYTKYNSLKSLNKKSKAFHSTPTSRGLTNFEEFAKQMKLRPQFHTYTTG